MYAVDRGDSYNRRTALMTMIPPYTINLTILDLAERIGEAILEPTISAPQDTRPESSQVTRSLAILEGKMSRQQILHALGLSDRKSYRKRYLLPALEHGFVKMARPESLMASHQNYQLSARERLAAR